MHIRHILATRAGRYLIGGLHLPQVVVYLHTERVEYEAHSVTRAYRASKWLDRQIGVSCAIQGQASAVVLSWDRE
jgi:hypothetical protein